MKWLSNLFSRKPDNKKKYSATVKYRKHFTVTHKSGEVVTVEVTGKVKEQVEHVFKSLTLQKAATVGLSPEMHKELNKVMEEYTTFFKKWE